MTKVDKLLHAFEAALREPWAATLSGQEKVWFLVYEPAEQRKVDLQIGEFEIRAKAARKTWIPISLKQVFPEWMARHEYREEYFADPTALADQLEYDFRDFVIQYLRDQIRAGSDGPHALIALTGVGALFGFCRLSEVLKGATESLQGRLLVFFPGEFSSNQYRLLDARDGWNYLARPITA
ncbi:MAG: BREX protein BrxB domain-containing protein [Bacteroidia bacterium]|nr:BREX protein BrxB domain-containing protein [Bacteroidia bacterium]